jgi:hypothetical protein
MTDGCCPKPIATIIKVGKFEAGLVGLDQALRNVYMSGLENEQEIQQSLLQRIKEFGNYVPPSTENDYNEALLREYRKYVLSITGAGGEQKQLGLR